MSKQATVSIVIPAYNEARYLTICLEALSRQTTRPLEIIVVDNNSTDQTATIAQSFTGVTVLSEPRQGIAAARNRGFDAARGDIIARLDADTRPPQDWLAHVSAVFDTPDRDAATGPVEDLPLGALGRASRELLAHRFNERLAGHSMLFGANMAVRRQAWRAIRVQLCPADDIHEDLDLAIHLHQAGFQIHYGRQMVMKTDARRYCQAPRHFHRYLKLWPRTFDRHDMPGVGQLHVLMYLLLAGQSVVRPLFLLHDRHQRRIARRSPALVKSVRRTAAP